MRQINTELDRFELIFLNQKSHLVGLSSSGLRDVNSVLSRLRLFGQLPMGGERAELAQCHFLGMNDSALGIINIELILLAHFVGVTIISDPPDDPFHVDQLTGSIGGAIGV